MKEKHVKMKKSYNDKIFGKPFLPFVLKQL